MITIKDLKQIAQSNWGNMNPSQRLTILSKVSELEPNSHNQTLVENAKADYEKWTQTTSYEMEVKIWQK